LRKKKSKIGINKNAKISIILAKIYIKNKMLKLEKAKIKGNRLMSSQLHFKKPIASVKGFGVWPELGFFLLTFKEEKPIIDLYQSPEQQTPALYIFYIIYSARGVCSGTW
jgi:hypothetical protein